MIRYTEEQILQNAFNGEISADYFKVVIQAAIEHNKQDPFHELRELQCEK